MPEPLPFVKISDPTIEMTFSINDSPFAGPRGQVRHLPQPRATACSASFSRTCRCTSPRSARIPSTSPGRGEMHLSILIETMRREGYEFQVSTPHVLNKEIDGKLCEPIERMVADVPESVCRRGHRQDFAAQGRAGVHDAGGQPDASGVPRAHARAVRLPQRVPHRHARRGHHGIHAGFLRARQGRDRAPSGRLARRV